MSLPLQVDTSSYRPLMTSLIHVRAGESTGSGRITVQARGGEAFPPSLQVYTDRGQDLLLLPDLAARGPIPVTLTLQSGARQVAWVAPEDLYVPAVSGITVDGRLDDWPVSARLDSHWLLPTTNGSAAAYIGWSAAGLTIGAHIPVAGEQAGDPRSFWDCTCLEVFIDTGAGVHQFWLTPVKDGAGWRLYAGEWKRSDSSIAATVYDDARVRGAVTVDAGSVSMEAAIPVEALGAPPGPGKTWRLAVELQGVGSGAPFRVGWPAPKSAGILDDSSHWGAVSFTAGKG
jgi:hypothetical protein